MTQADKDLILRDLCGRLSYGVKVYRKWIAPLSGSPEEGIFDFCIFDIEILLSPHNWVSTEKGIREVREYDIKPYLRPMSSMTEEERAERIGLLWELEGHINEDVAYKYQDWLNKHHFDYRGLIPKGLALEAPEGIYD